MKKRIVLIISVLSITVITILILLLTNKSSYVIKVSIVDEHSPDRILTVYNNKDEKIEVDHIEYMDGTLLCNGYNTAVHFGDIENEKELRVILKDKTSIVAKIVKEEVK